MTQLGDIVRDEINTSPSIRADLQKKIINIRALAKHIKKKNSLNYSLDAIISAIRRYQENSNLPNLYFEPSKLIKGASLSSKNRISSIHLEKNEEVLKVIPQIFERIELINHRILRVVHAQKAIKIFLDQAFLDQVVSLFQKKYIKSIKKNMAEVIIEVDENSWETPGVLSFMTSELFLNNINIYEIHTCIPEIVFIIKESDLMKAYEVLYKCSKGESN